MKLSSSLPYLKGFLEFIEGLSLYVIGGDSASIAARLYRWLCLVELLSPIHLNESVLQCQAQLHMD